MTMRPAVTIAIVNTSRGNIPTKLGFESIWSQDNCPRGESLSGADRCWRGVFVVRTTDLRKSGMCFALELERRNHRHERRIDFARPIIAARITRFSTGEKTRAERDAPTRRRPAADWLTHSTRLGCSARPSPCRRPPATSERLSLRMVFKGEPPRPLPPTVRYTFDSPHWRKMN